MKLSEVISAIQSIEKVDFELENGQKVPEHFHVTEVGKITKHFIDCGGTVRKEEVVSFQLWNAHDIDHRLKPAKLLSIIQLSIDKLSIPDLEVEVEYQADTIGKYGLSVKDGIFLLTAKHTDCLAKDNCGIPEGKMKRNLADLTTKNTSCCPPGGGCC